MQTMKRTHAIAVAAVAALLATVVVAFGDGTVITQPIRLPDNSVTSAKIVDGTIATADVADDQITLAKLANMATASFLGRTTASTGDPEVLTATQATALLNSYAGSIKGLVPAGAGSTTKFLREDGTWAVAAATGSPSLGTPSGTNKNFNSFQTDCNVNLTSTATKDWLSFQGGWGSGNPFYGIGISTNLANANGLHYKFASSRLKQGLYFLGNYTGGNIASGAISVTSTAADDVTASALSQTTFNVEFAGNTTGYGYGFDVPLIANETGTVTTCVQHASFGIKIDASFSDGSVSPTTATIANFDSGGGTRGISLITVAFTNGANGGNRLRVQFTSGGTQGPFTGSLWPAYIYW